VLIFVASVRDYLTGPSPPAYQTFSRSYFLNYESFPPGRIPLPPSTLGPLGLIDCIPPEPSDGKSEAGPGESFLTLRMHCSLQFALVYRILLGSDLRGLPLPFFLCCYLELRLVTVCSVMSVKSFSNRHLPLGFSLLAPCCSTSAKYPQNKNRAFPHGNRHHFHLPLVGIP